MEFESEVIESEVLVAEESKDVAVVMDNAGAILSIIQKVASDPNSDVDKMERLMVMHVDMVERDAVQSYKKSMAICQEEMPTVVKDAENKQTNSSYAKFESILITTQSTYTRNGFALSFGTDISPIETYIRVTCEVMHNAGHSKHYFLDLPPDGSGIKGTANKTGVHAAGSTLSYGRRYLFCMIFNIAVAEEDKDGNPPTQPTVTPEQVKKLIGAAKAVGEDYDYICKKARVNKVEELWAVRYDACMNHLKSLMEKEA